MESQSFVFLKTKWDVPEPPSKINEFTPMARMARINEISVIAIDRLHLTEPEQVGFSIASRKISFPVQSDNPHNLFQLLQVFLKNLPGPVCLVAHNGDNHDFSILRFELERVLSECEESVSDIAGTFNGIYCVDSAEAFATLFAPSHHRPLYAELEETSKRLFLERHSENIEPNASSLVTSEWNMTDFDSELILITQIASDLYDEKRFDREEMERDVQDEYNLSKLTQHGKKKRAGCEDEPNWQNIRREIKSSNERTPLRGTNVDGKLREDTRKRRALDLSLRAVYLRVFGETITPCSTEGEVEALSEIVAQLGIPILEIFDRKKVLFCSKVFT